MIDRAIGGRSRGSFASAVRPATINGVPASAKIVSSPAGQCIDRGPHTDQRGRDIVGVELPRFNVTFTGFTHDAPPHNGFTTLRDSQHLLKISMWWRLNGWYYLGLTLFLNFFDKEPTCRPFLQYFRYLWRKNLFLLQEIYKFTVMQALPNFRISFQ